MKKPTIAERIYALSHPYFTCENCGVLKKISEKSTVTIKGIKYKVCYRCWFRLYHKSESYEVMMPPLPQ